MFCKQRHSVGDILGKHHTNLSEPRSNLFLKLVSFPAGFAEVRSSSVQQWYLIPVCTTSELHQLNCQPEPQIAGLIDLAGHRGRAIVAS